MIDNKSIVLNQRDDKYCGRVQRVNVVYKSGWFGVADTSINSHESYLIKLLPRK